MRGVKEAISPISASATRLDLSPECHAAAPISTSSSRLTLRTRRRSALPGSILQGPRTCLQTHQEPGVLLSP